MAAATRGAGGARARGASRPSARASVRPGGGAPAPLSVEPASSRRDGAPASLRARPRPPAAAPAPFGSRRAVPAPGFGAHTSYVHWRNPVAFLAALPPLSEEERILNRASAAQAAFDGAMGPRGASANAASGGAHGVELGVDEPVSSAGVLKAQPVLVSRREGRARLLRLKSLVIRAVAAEKARLRAEDAAAVRVRVARLGSALATRALNSASPGPKAHGPRAEGLGALASTTSWTALVRKALRHKRRLAQIEGDPSVYRRVGLVLDIDRYGVRRVCTAPFTLPDQFALTAYRVKRQLNTTEPHMAEGASAVAARLTDRDLAEVFCDSVAHAHWSARADPSSPLPPLRSRRVDLA